MKIRELVGVAHAFTCPFACPSAVMAKKSWFFRSYWDDWAQWPWVEAASEFRFNAPPRIAELGCDRQKLAMPFSPGCSQPAFHSILLQPQAIHTGVLVYGSEYWYGLGPWWNLWLSSWFCRLGGVQMDNHPSHLIFCSRNPMMTWRFPHLKSPPVILFQRNFR